MDDRKSTSYYLVYLGTTPISWKFMKQKIIAFSSTKTKYKALGYGIIEFYGLVSFFQNFNFPLFVQLYYGVIIYVPCIYL